MPTTSPCTECEPHRKAASFPTRFPQKTVAARPVQNSTASQRRGLFNRRVTCSPCAFPSSLVDRWHRHHHLAGPADVGLDFCGRRIAFIADYFHCCGGSDNHRQQHLENVHYLHLPHTSHRVIPTSCIHTGIKGESGQV